MARTEKVGNPGRKTGGASPEAARGFSAWTYVLMGIRANRGRSALIVTGVAVLITFFVLFSAIGAGLQEYVEDEGDRKGYDRMGGRTAAQYERVSRIVGEWAGVLTVIIGVIMAMTVGNTMLLSVTERTREIGTLRAVGFSRGRIVQLVVMEAVFLTGLGFLAGSVAGLSAALVLDFMFTATAGQGWYFAPASVNPAILLGALLLSVGVGAVASLPPAHRAAGVDPVEALRYE